MRDHVIVRVSEPIAIVPESVVRVPKGHVFASAFGVFASALVPEGHVYVAPGASPGTARPANLSPPDFSAAR